ncbi:hypothetical protein GOP47_0021699 [Adiantum capillus-veneris]|uniref:K Homology domain-containing protein n=1 Tax=Adiantum capillus-veneris TaxID=13818 RepID=A0A9D4U8B2_ADICA|nr:hypothetical protein GOP47_0021699 [Adiantum capillus-veneris]
MALRTVARLRSTCGLQLRTLAQITQDSRKVFACSYSADASTNEGFHDEEKLGNPAIIPDNKAAGEETEDALQTEQSKETQFRASIKVGAPYLRFIVGRRGMAVKNIEKATNTRIVVPPAKDITNIANLVVKSGSQKSVDQALAKIKDVLHRAERIPDLQYSHFISLPLASHEGLVEQLRRFRKNVLNEEEQANSYVSWFPETAEKEISIANAVKTTDKASKIKSSRILDPDLEAFFSDEESSDDENELRESPLAKISNYLFIKPETVHITVVMLKLFTDESVKAAADVLEGLQSKVLEILDGKEPKVFLRGVDCLRGNPAEARVLAMKVIEPDNNNYLQRACHFIRDAFSEAGLVAVADMKQELTLHATLMSTSRGRRLGNKPFDARKILAKYRLQDWGEHTMNELSLKFLHKWRAPGDRRFCLSDHSM